jgi:hypothetical protein
VIVRCGGRKAFQLFASEGDAAHPGRDRFGADHLREAKTELMAHAERFASERIHGFPPIVA